MESIGDKIRKTREEKGYSIDQVARDTHISKRFLEALESENYSSLPGDSYVLGFLRSYSEYLGMNADEVVQLYRNMKLQEQPAPMNELIVKNGLSFTSKVSIAAASGVLLLVLLIILFRAASTPLESENVVQVQVPAVASDKLIRMDTASMVRTFTVENIIRVPVNGIDTDLNFLIKNDEAFVKVLAQDVLLPLGQENQLDLNQDGKSDIKIMVQSLDTKASPNQLVVSLDRLIQSPGGARTAELTVASIAAVSDPASLGNTRIASRIKPSQNFPEFSGDKVAVTLVFEGQSFFRYEIDGAKREERLSQFEETLTLSASSRIRLWFSNGGRVSLRIGSRTLKAGTDGEVATWQLAWLEIDGQRQLSLAALY